MACIFNAEVRTFSAMDFLVSIVQECVIVREFYGLTPV